MSICSFFRSAGPPPMVIDEDDVLDESGGSELSM